MAKFERNMLKHVVKSLLINFVTLKHSNLHVFIKHMAFKKNVINDK